MWHFCSLYLKKMKTTLSKLRFSGVYFLCDGRVYSLYDPCLFLLLLLRLSVTRGAPRPEADPKRSRVSVDARSAGELCLCSDWSLSFSKCITVAGFVTCLRLRNLFKMSILAELITFRNFLLPSIYSPSWQQVPVWWFLDETADSPL